MKSKILLSVFLIFSMNSVFSQKTFENVYDYNNYIVEKHTEVMEKYLVYIKTSVHSSSDNKIERKLHDMVDEITLVINDLEKIIPLDADSVGYLQSVIDALKVEKEMYKNDFKDVDILKGKSENSYEDMEKYFEAEDVANKKMQTAYLKTETAQNKFATDNGFELVESNSKLSMQLEEIAFVNKYSRRIYLQYFRTYKPVSLFFEALNNKLYTEADSLNIEIVKTCTTSLDSLAFIGSFNNNSAMKTKATTLINFYKSYAEVQFVQLLEISQKEDLTQADVDKYNKIMETFNNKHTTYSEAYFTAYDTFMKTNIKE